METYRKGVNYAKQERCVNIKVQMELNKCDLTSAVKFAGHNQTCYNLAMAVAQAKDEEKFKAEEQQWIDKACEWLKENASGQLRGQ